MTGQPQTEWPGAPRYLQYVVGAMCVALALVLLGVVLAAALPARQLFGLAPPTSLGERATVLAGVVVLGVLAGRLLLSRGARSDGALLSPTEIRIGGAIFILGAAVPLLLGMWGIIGAAAHVYLGVRCFKLAKQRDNEANANANLSHHVA